MGGKTRIGDKLDKIIYIPRIEDPKIQKHLERVEIEWKELKRAAIMALRSDIKTLTDNEYVDKIQIETNEAIREMDHVVSKLQLESERKLRKIKAIQILMSSIGGACLLELSYLSMSR